MTNLHEAFKIPSNKENKEFVNNPYIPLNSLTYSIPQDELNYISVTQHPLTTGRCFDIKYGSKNCFLNETINKF